MPTPSNRFSPSIFYVEDNLGDVLLLRTAFQELGRMARLSIACNGRDALLHLSELTRTHAELPALMLLDLNLPRGNGFEVLRHRLDDGRPTIPVAVLSSSPNPSDCEHSIALGAIAYLVKPLSYQGYLEIAGDIGRLLGQVAQSAQPPHAA